MNNTPKLAIAIGFIDDDLVTGAVEYTPSKRRFKVSFNNRAGWVAIAACLCFMIVAIAAIISIQKPSDIGVEDPSLPGEMAPFVYVNDTLYKRTKFVSSDDVTDECDYLGEISSQVSSSHEPSENFQANDDLIGAKIYQAGNDIIVVFNGYYELYCPFK